MEEFEENKELLLEREEANRRWVNKQFYQSKDSFHQGLSSYNGQPLTAKLLPVLCYILGPMKDPVGFGDKKEDDETNIHLDWIHTIQFHRLGERQCWPQQSGEWYTPSSASIRQAFTLSTPVSLSI